MIENLSAVDPSVGIQKTHHGLTENAFAGARFADNGKALSLIDIQCHSAKRRQDMSAEPEFHDEVTDLHQCFRVGRESTCPGSIRCLCLSRFRCRFPGSNILLFHVYRIAHIHSIPLSCTPLCAVLQLSSFCICSLKNRRL